MTKPEALQQIYQENPYWCPSAKSSVLDAAEVLLGHVDVSPEHADHLQECIQACRERETTIWGQSNSWQDFLTCLMDVLETQAVYDLVMQHAQTAG